ncbi:MAG: hypothetical protein UH241_07390 [Acutalibacteraceae bacterium]|nr:hypothetical protein [Acutalibacteraceae bacterium]
MKKKLVKLIMRHSFAIMASIVIVIAFGVYYYQKEVVKNINPPQIIFPGDFKDEISVKTVKDQLLKNVTAFDEEDGDLSKEIIIEKMSNITDDNTRDITYVVCDSDNNVTKVKKTITYTDYKSPVISSLEITPTITERTYSSILACFTATDVIDGDISEKIKISSIDTSEESIAKSIFPVVLSVTNSCGDVSYLETSVVLVED